MRSIESTDYNYCIDSEENDGYNEEGLWLQLLVIMFTTIRKYIHACCKVIVSKCLSSF